MPSLAFGVIGLSLVIALVALTAFLLLRRQIMHLQRDYERQTHALLALQGSIKVLSGEALSHRQDLTAVLKSVERLSELNQEARLEMRLRDADRSPYSQAIQLIRHGQTRSSVRKLCSLTESEVDLLFSLHGHGIAAGIKEDEDSVEDSPPRRAAL